MICQITSSERFPDRQDIAVTAFPIYISDIPLKTIIFGLIVKSGG